MADVTHVIYTALSEKTEDIYGGWSDPVQIATNVGMLRNLFEPLASEATDADLIAEALEWGAPARHPLHSTRRRGRRVIHGPQEEEGPSIWGRLRSRKVVQWGIAYAAGAWGLLQGLEYLSQILRWPEYLQRIALLATVAGLPIVLVLAWYHGDRGEQRVRGPELLIITVLFLAGGSLFWWYGRTAGFTQPGDAARASATAASMAADPRPSIAVLPFHNRSDAREDAYFVDGIHDDILTQLSKISALKVISRSSVARFRDTRLPLKDIADQLGVTNILEGSAQRGGDRIRINVQLIDAETDAHLWAETYDRELTAANIFAIQSELAAAIAEALETSLTPREQARVVAVPTQNLEAWEAYQLGKQRMAPRTSAGLTDAERFFQRAIDLDPAFALAHVGLADVVRLQNLYGGTATVSPLARAEVAAQVALNLDPDLADAWVAKGGIAMSRGDDAVAEGLLRHAIDLDPNCVTAHHWLSIVLAGSNSGGESLDHIERALQLDPLSQVINTTLAEQLDEVGRFDEAEQRYRKAIEIDPTSPVAYASLASMRAYARNRFPDAVQIQMRAVILDEDSPSLLGGLALLWLDLGEVGRAVETLGSALRRWPDDPVMNIYAAAVAASLGDRHRAESSAKKVLAQWHRAYPRVVAVMRNADLARGDVASARARYATGYPELLNRAVPPIGGSNLALAIDLSLVLQQSGETDRADALLDASERALPSLPRLGFNGYGIADAQIHALRGNRAQALAALRDAERMGWRGPHWRYFRDIDPDLAAIRSDPAFAAVFADIEKDLARQRAELAARPKDVRLDATTSPTGAETPAP